MIQHVFNVRPGYDCRVECKHKVKGQHGIHCDEWVYAVVDRDAQAALELRTYTPFYPNGFEPGFDNKFWGANLALHLGFAINKEQVKNPEPHPNCAYIGLCFDGGSWGLLADELVQAHFDQTSENRDQPKLWQALEEKFVLLVQRANREALEDGDLKWVRCKCCKGEGVVEK